MRKYFVIAGFVAALIAASSASRAGTGEGSTSASNGRSSSRKVPTFTLDQAIRTALQRNPTLLNAEQEIKRTKGIIIEVRAQALPQITASGSFEWVDPNLVGARILGETPGTGTPPGGGAASVVDSPLSQVRDTKHWPLHRRHQVSPILSRAMCLTTSAFLERSWFLTAPPGRRSEGLSFSETEPTSRSATLWTNSSRP